jgi:general secretion pathway protein G
LAQELGRDEPPPGKYMRVTEEDGGTKLRLELVARTFEPHEAGAGPQVALVGAVHIADKSFYEALQAYLDAKDVVLFEGVKPPGSGRIEHEGDLTDEARIAATERRLRFIGAMIELHRHEQGGYPDSLADLAKHADSRLSKFVAGEEAAQDAWGRAIVYRLNVKPAEDPYDLVSYGADGKPGGDGVDGDIALADIEPPDRREVEPEEGGGLQSRLADALGLVFQLDAMDHTHPNWRNSDLSVDQVQDRLEKAGADSGQLFSMLDGSSLLVRLAAGALKLVSMLPGGQTMMKLVMVEMLGSADELLTAGMPRSMQTMMEVILKDRNAVVIDDLKALVKDEPGLKSVGVIYGAGHMADLEKRLTGELGYKESSEEWFSAIEVDAREAGLTARDVKQMRRMVQSMIERQLKTAKRRSKSK